MAIATRTQYWTSRINGTDPEAATGTFNDSWTESGSGGSAVGDYWVITSNGTWSRVPSSTAYTMVASFEFSDAAEIPANGTVLMRLDNGVKRVEVRSKGNANTLDLVGATTVTTPDLDLSLAEDNPVPVILRLTMDASGNARLYMHEIIEDDDAVTHYLSVTGSSSSSKEVRWGNSDGTVKWATLYFSNAGSFSPDELMPSDFAQDALVRMGLGVVEQLKNSQRLFLKTQVSESSINYAYDLSSDMVNRIAPPSIHVMIKELASPIFDSLSGAKISQNYNVIVFVVTKGTNYENAYRHGLNIMGDVFDELYTNTGLLGTTDSLISFNAELDTRKDNDDVVCVHRLDLQYMRRIDMRHR
jgi:hypothetical protein